MRIFANIARSENIHMDAISGLMDLFEIDDPSAGAGVGEFRNLELQSLYDDLVDKGSQSLVDAILVGGAIEEIDILDLQSYLDETSDGKIVQVYQNLLQGSINHLASFARTYERQTGDDYQPQYLSQEDYENLINQGSIAGNSQRGQRMKAGSQGNGMSW